MIADGDPIAVISEQECAALLLAAQGFKEAVAARRYGKSPRTYRRHLTSAVEKLEARNLVNAVAIAVELGIITIPVGIIAIPKPRPRRAANRYDTAGTSDTGRNGAADEHRRPPAVEHDH